jgi:hypothetical protein
LSSANLHAQDLKIMLLALQLLTVQSGSIPTVTSTVSSEKARDAVLEKAVSRLLRLEKEDRNYYRYNRVDLDGDGAPEVLVQVQGPFVCGTGGGCPLLVFKKKRDGYDTVALIGLAWLPLVVSDHRTRGWSDLILWQRSYGNAQPSHYEVLVFDGKSYSRRPSGGQADEAMSGVAYMIDGRQSTSGILLTH